MGSWQKFQQLPPGERWLLWQSLVLLPLVALALRIVGLRRLQDQMQQWMPAQHPPPTMTADSLARIVQIAARRSFYPANCLQQSLLLWWFLGCQGLPGELRIGVQKVADRIIAHAWVESQGRILNDRQDIDQEYVPFNGAIASWSAKSS